MPSDLSIPDPRVIILCFDGSAGQFGSSNTNVVKFYSILDKSCPLEQTAYYQPGVGTYFQPGVVSPALTLLAKAADLAFAWYLNDHVIGGYRFLMQNYRAGDKICLFGFSRGAYTARALAGFLYKIGLLLPNNDELVTFAFDLYKREDDAGIGLAAEFHQSFCASVKIDFLGVWDTVPSVGLVYGRGLPFTSSNDAVRLFRHALALDEHRARFQPNPFHYKAPQASADHVESAPAPDVKEVWFVGCHEDVGGGAVTDKVVHSLTRITLQWMVKEVILSKCGIKFDAEAMRRAHIDESIILLTTPTKVTGRKSAVGTEAAKPVPQTTTWGEDGLKGIHDQLTINPVWWFLEIFPTTFIWQDPRKDGRWEFERGINLGRGRTIWDLEPVFHTSVDERRKDAKLGYRPKAKLLGGVTPRYAD